jgi:hypothetical protein
VVQQASNLILKEEAVTISSIWDLQQLVFLSFSSDAALLWLVSFEHNCKILVIEL